MNPTEGTQIMSDEIFEKKLEFFLRSTGRLFPITPAQVEAFEKRNPTYPTSTFNADPMAILQKGYINYTLPKVTTYTFPDNEWFRMAARNGREIPADILRKMKEDREKDENK